MVDAEPDVNQRRPAKLDDVVVAAERMLLDVSLLCDPKRHRRLACVRQTAERTLSDGAAESEKGALWSWIKKGLETNAKTCDTTITLLALLARSDGEAGNQALCTLVMQLGHSNVFVKSRVYITLTQLATDRRCTTYQLLAPHLETLAPDIVERMTRTPHLFLEVLQLTKQNHSRFLQATLQYTLPRLIENDDDKTLELVVKGIGGGSLSTICFNNAPAVLRVFIMMPPMKRDRCIRTFCKKIREGEAEEMLRTLIKGYSIELLGFAVANLGHASGMQRKRALEGLQFISKQRSKLALAQYLHEEVLAIISWLNEELQNGHGKRSIAHKAMVTRSVGALIDLIGTPISSVTPQLVATLSTTMQVGDLMLPSLESWTRFVFMLQEHVGPFIGQLAAALLSAWPTLGQEEKGLAVGILTHVAVDCYDFYKANLLTDMPDISAIKDDIPEVYRKLSVPQKPEQRLSRILDRTANDFVAVQKQALTELLDFLQKDDFLEQATSGNAFDTIIGQLMRRLLETARHEDDAIRALSLENLAVIGAVDPDRLPSTSSEQSRLLLRDFRDKEEVTVFATHLIGDVLIGAYKASHDTKHQSALAYALQELLKFCGFSSGLLHTSGTISLKTRQRWNELKPYADTLAPLLRSKYVVQHAEPSLQTRPYYTHTSSHKEWIQVWTNALIVETDEQDNIGVVFGVFRSVIRDHDLSIAQYILPHLVVNTIVHGTENQGEQIYDEIVAVLQDQVTPTAPSERRQLCAQVIFDLLDHMSIWQRSVTVERKVAKKRDVVEANINRVDSLFKKISQELMAKASLQCRAYARSLLNHEQQIRSLRNTKPEKLQAIYEDLHLIYANLDEPDGMEGISSFVLFPSLDHQIREHESTGRWTSAQSCWEVKIQDEPDKLDQHIGLLRCLRSLGHYDTMRTHILGILSTHRDWQEALAPFYIEGCCILSDWEAVRRSLYTHGTSPQHAMAQVMLAMHDGDIRQLQDSIVKARDLLGSPLCTNKDYVGAYDAMTQLHMLHEIELISRVSLPSVKSSVAHLEHTLAKRLQSTLPSFKTREPILSMRRSAMSTQYNKELRGLIGQCWIASSKIARSEGHLQSAYSAALQASQANVDLAFVQHAKLRVARGDQGQAALQEMANCLLTAAKPSPEDYARLHKYANANLFYARLADTSGRRSVNEIIELYKRCTEIDPSSEKMWYHFGHYYDRDQTMRVQLSEPLMQDYNTCRALLRSTLFGTKYFYRTLPRILTIWLNVGDEKTLIAALAKKKAGKTMDQSTSDHVNYFIRINDIVKRSANKLAPYQWLAVLAQLLSRVNHRNEDVRKTLQELIAYVLTMYPDQAMWNMVAGLQSTDMERRNRFMDVVNRVKASAKQKIGKKIDLMIKMAKELLYLCDYNVPRETKHLSVSSTFPELLSLAKQGEIILPMQSSLSVTMPPTGTADPHFQIFADDLPRIVDLDNTVEVLSSLQRPRKLLVKSSDGQVRAFLCKPNDDLRKDARLMEFDGMINNLLQSNPESRKRRLYIRTYAVVTLNEECGLIEWVPNTVGLRHVLQRLYALRGIPLYTQQVKQDLELACKDPKRAGDIFEKKVLSSYPPVFNEWLLAEFPEPSAWLSARLKYGRTLAVMSMVGYVLGLGDRHGENILFDSVSGDTVHVDLNCLFERGATFEVPERVPFRLTQNLVDALGVTGVEGVFRKAAEISMAVLRENRESLTSVLEAMVHDPLVEWGHDNRMQKGRVQANAQEDPRIAKARKSLDPVNNRLLGKMRVTVNSVAGDGGHSILASDWSAELSTNSLVDALIRDATSSTLLAQMYVGWSAYL